MKLYYKIDPTLYDAAMDKVQQEFGMNKEVEEERTILTLDDDSQIELVSGSFDPSTDEYVMIRVVLNDKSLKTFFNSVFGMPYRERK